MFLDRTVFAGIKKLIAFLGRFTPEENVRLTDKKLALIGNPRNIRSREFFAIRILFLVLGFVIALILNYTNLEQLIDLFSSLRTGMAYSSLLNLRNPVMLMIYFGVINILLFFLLPVAWLNREVRKVKQEFERGFPDALDLLSVCAEAGLGFDQAMQRVGDYMQNFVGSEFRRVVSEMEVGVSRADALRNISERLDISEFSSFTTIIIQSETLGMKISDVLHSQAEQYRILRLFKAKEIAYRLPARMIVPMALLILPSLLVVILAPLIPSLIELFS
jgi:tight adherence protein C